MRVELLEGPAKAAAKKPDAAGPIGAEGSVVFAVAAAKPAPLLLLVATGSEYGW